MSAGAVGGERSGGLVDPTLVRALEQSGYDHSLDGVEPASLEEALAHAPPRRAARARSGCAVAAGRGRRSGGHDRPPARRDDRHRRDRQGPVRRRGRAPPGGGTPGSSSTAAATSRSGESARSSSRTRSPSSIPSPDESIGSINVARGGIATSGLNVRIWRRADGGYCPSSARPEHRLAGVERA